MPRGQFLKVDLNEFTCPKSSCMQNSCLFDVRGELYSLQRNQGQSSTLNNHLLKLKFHLFLKQVFMKNLQCARYYGINK